MPSYEYLAWDQPTQTFKKVTSGSGGVDARSAVEDLGVSTTQASFNFSSAMVNNNYALNLVLINTVDLSPQFQPLIITAKSTTGFTVSWNSGLDSSNYKLSYVAMPQM